MYENLEVFEKKYLELEKDMIDPEVLSNSSQYQKVAKEHAELQDIVLKYRQYKSATEELESTRALYEEKLDPEMREMVNEEIRGLEKQIAKIDDEIKILLVPKDENDDKNVIIEIRGGAGGDEAALFAGVLFRMYTRYAERRNWKVDIMNSN